MIDYIVVGSGIVGSFIAWELSKYNLKVLVLEKESDIANGQTIANSGIIHSGHDPLENTLKAKLCVRGNLLYRKLETKLQIPLRKTGAYVIAHSKEDLKVLADLQKRALYNGVKEVFLLSKEEALKEVKNLKENIKGVLSLPSTMVTFPWEVCFNLLENAIENGVELELNQEVTKIVKKRDYYVVVTNNKTEYQTKGIINSAGVYSDIIASYIEKEVPFKIIPRRGEYFVLDHSVADYLTKVIYPLPDIKGKGVLLTPQVHGNILIGPNAEEILDRDDLATTKEGLEYVKTEALKQAKNIPFHANIRSFSGIRASSTYQDFYIKESKLNKKVFHLGGIDSPGLTAAPAISEYLINLINQKYPLTKKQNFKDFQKTKSSFKNASIKEKTRLIKEKPLHGKIVCRCELVTEQEIIEAINSPIGVDTIKGIKKHTRAGAGLCQGGYCENLILKIIAREKQKKLTKVNYYEKNTPILLKESKET